MRYLAFAVTTLLAIFPACALDASGADILGLRLGMSQADVTANLATQGFSTSAASSACPANQRCLMELKAVTKDGTLLITISDETGAQQVKYVFRRHGAGESQGIQTAILDRYGEPNQRQPMTWCRAVDVDGVCPHEQATLTFQPETLTITLMSGMAD